MSNDDKRAEAAEALREFAHLFVGRASDDHTLDQITQAARAWTAELEQREIRVRDFHGHSFEKWHQGGDELPEAGRRHVFADSIVTGESNPMGLAARQWREEEVSCAEAVFDRAFEGAPGRAHGGILAALLDETMGRVPAILGALAFTVQLDISYRAPTPLYELVTARAWCAKREGRKFFISAEVRSKDGLVAEAQAIFVAVDPTRFVAPV
ncbi:MAG: PaaI family thioesterase [Actinomycetota bacterium]|jgi:hypothetical protein